MEELGRVTVVRAVRLSPFSLLVVNGDTFRDGPVWADGSTAFTCAADTFRCHYYFVKERHSLLDGIYCLSAYQIKVFTAIIY